MQDQQSLKHFVDATNACLRHYYTIIRMIRHSLPIAYCSCDAFFLQYLIVQDHCRANFILFRLHMRTLSFIFQAKTILIKCEMKIHRWRERKKKNYLRTHYTTNGRDRNMPNIIHKGMININL